MKIVHISTRDKIGGASIAAFRLHSAMLQNHLDSSMIVLEKLNSTNPEIIKLEKQRWQQWEHLIYWYDKYRLRNYHLSYVFSTGMVGLDISSHPLVQSADVIYIHWINYTLSIANIKQLLALKKTVFWFMHDMWPWTGGCHHSFDCNRYIEHCGKCLCLGSENENDLSHKIHLLKFKYFALYTNLYPIVPSRWMGEKCQKSSLFKNRKVYFIPNIIDTDIYKPIEKTVARKAFNLPLDKKLILFGADIGVNNLYKGWDYLKIALQEMQLTNLEVVVLGSSYNSSAEECLSYRIHSMGYLYDNVALAMLYNAADVFVSPSLAESFGLMIAEAMACSTPVVAFGVGGVMELIKHKETGYLAGYKDSMDLAEGIRWCLTKWSAEENGGAARDYIINYCSYQKGIELHREILEHHVNV